MDVWAELPWWLRIGISVVLLIAGVLVIWLGMSTTLAGLRRRNVWVIGLTLIGVGSAAILFGGKSDSERNGYRF